MATRRQCRLCAAARSHAASVTAADTRSSEQGLYSRRLSRVDLRGITPYLPAFNFLTCYSAVLE